MSPKHSYPARNYAVGRLLFTLRSRARLTQAQLASRIGIHRRSIQKWESGESYPNADNLRNLISVWMELGVFTPGQEANEVAELWQQVSQDAPQPLPHFDQAWFARLPMPRQVAAEAPTPATEASAAPGSAFGPAQAAPLPPPTLPFQPTPFVGREAELQELAALLADPTCRLLTLLGPGGIGKTRLAVEAATRYAERNRVAVAFAPLTSIGASNQLVSTIGDALNLALAGQVDAKAYLLDTLRARKLLLLLDDFERHLDDDDLIYQMLEHAPGVVILVTARARLNLQAEWLFHVEGLRYPPDTAPGLVVASNSEELSAYSAVQLFAQRARQFKPDAPLTDATLLSMARICQYVGGLPLAIELAAAGIRTQPIAEIERQIRASLDVLATTARDVPVRHRSLRAVFDHAWEQLTESERAILARVAIFRGGWEQAAVEAICAQITQEMSLPYTFSPAILAALIDKSLVQQRYVAAHRREPHPARRRTDPEPGAHPRYSLLEPIREYAFAQLDMRGEAATLQWAHAHYYVTLAETASAQWDDPASSAAIVQLEREQDNLRAALQWAVDNHSGPHGGANLTLGLRLAGALRKYWRRRGAISEGRAWLETLLALEYDPLHDDAAVRIRALQEAAWLASDQHDYTQAAARFEQSRALGRAQGAREDDTQLLINTALEGRAAGRYPQAAALLEDALARQRALGGRGSLSSNGLGLLLYLLGMVRREQGDFSRAMTLFAECAELHRDLGQYEDLAVAWLALSDVARDQGDVAQVRHYGEQGLASLRRLRVQWAIGFALNNLALAACLEGDFAHASMLIDESVALFRAQKAEGSLAEVLITHGRVLGAQGEFAAAQAALRESLALGWSVGPRLLVPAAFEELAALATHAGDAGLATRLFAAAAHLRAQMGVPVRPSDQPRLDHALAAARMSLGADGFTQLWDAAAALPTEHFLAELQKITISSAAPPAGFRLLAEPAAMSHRSAYPPDWQAAHAGPRVAWGLAQDVPALVGRGRELGTLTEWVVDERCRVITLLGIGGVGKTSLALTLAHQIAPHFDVVVFRSLGEAPPLAELLDHLIPTISSHPVAVPAHLPDKLELLVDLLRQSRCLVILDNLETLLQAETADVRYLDGYEAYAAFFRTLGEIAHQSCVLLTSREQPHELAALIGPRAAVRTMRVTGLPEDACRALLADQELTGSSFDVAVLAHRYDGNPLALRLVAEPIRVLFHGDIATFLTEGNLFFNGVGELLGQQIGRASALERSLLTWLALAREPLTLARLMAVLAEEASRAVVLATLQALWRRNLIEQGEANLTFTLQPVVLEYLTERIIEQAANEIAQGKAEPGGLEILRRHALVQATAKEYVRRSQERLIATPVLVRLAESGGVESVDQQIGTLLARQREIAPAEQGYAPGNLVNLLRLLRGDLRNVNLARLALHDVYWQGVEAQGAILTQASIRDNVFTEAFGIVHTVASTPSGSLWAASSINGAVQVWRDEGRTTSLSIAAHTKQVKALAFSPDEQILATASWDCTIKLWDTRHGALLAVLEGHREYVQDIAFSPDGRMLASVGDDRTLRIWDVATAGCQITIEAHSDNAYGVDWSPDGQRLVTCGFDQLVRIWDAARGELIRTFSGHTRPVSKVVFSPDGKLLASGGFDRVVRVWDVHNGECIKLYAEHSSTIMALAWSPDGRTLASCSYDGTIRLWQPPLDHAQQVLLGHAASINSIAFTTGGKLLLSGSDDQTVRVWDVASGSCTRVIAGYGLLFFDLVWSPDGRSLFSANSDTTLTLWNVTEGRARQTLHGHTHSVYGVDWSPDGRWLASSGFDQAVRIWSAESGLCVRIIPAPTDAIYRAVRWSPDGHWLASAGRDRAVRIWDIATGKAQWVGRGHTGPINEVVWSPYGQRLVSCSEDRTLRLWRAADGELLQTLTGHQSSVAGVTWSPDGRRLASCGGGGAAGELFLWDAERGAQVNTLVGHSSVVSKVVWSQDGQRLFSGGMTGEVRWWDAASGANLYARQRHTSWIRSLGVSPDGATLASSGEDGVIHLWDTDRAELIRTLRIDRPYERMDITGLVGLNEAQRAALYALGAVEQSP